MFRPLLSVLLVLGATAAPAATTNEFIDRMDEEHATDEPVASPMTATEPLEPVETEMVAYADVEGTRVSGYLARRAGAETGPGVIVIHEWWGLNDNVKAMARQLADAGYTALAVDLYEGEVAADRETASRLARGSGERRARLEENLRQAHAYLTSRAGAERVGVIGWCFGGAWSLRTGLLLGDAIDGVVIYYGRLETDPAALEPLAAPVLGLFGDQDSGIPVEDVRQFEAALAALGKPASIHVYEGAGHAFANPSGTRYQKAAAEDAWAKTLDFFARHLQP